MVPGGTQRARMLSSGLLFGRMIGQGRQWLRSNWRKQNWNRLARLCCGSERSRVSYGRKFLSWAVSCSATGTEAPWSTKSETKEWVRGGGKESLWLVMSWEAALSPHTFCLRSVSINSYAAAAEEARQRDRCWRWVASPVHSFAKVETKRQHCSSTVSRPPLCYSEKSAKLFVLIHRRLLRVRPDDDGTRLSRDVS